MTLWNERPLSLRGIIVNEQTARNAISKLCSSLPFIFMISYTHDFFTLSKSYILISVDMARGVAAIAAMKKRLETQPPISVDGDRVSSSATISHQLQPQRIEENGEEQGPEVHILEEDSPNHSPKKKAERTAMDRV
ncbi:hypothetical protein AHAS_Ahas05G0100500 [Arachis hypogaea]